MTRTFKAMVVVLMGLTLLFMVAGSTGAADEPQVVRVTLTDSRVDLSQYIVAPGKSVQFVVTNQGTRAHQFVVQPYGEETVNSENAAVIAPGTQWTIRRTLGAGIYSVMSADGNRVKEGMVGILAAQAAPVRTFPIQMEFVVSLLVFVVGCTYIIGDTLGLRLTTKRAN